MVAEDGMRLKNNTVFLCPGRHHMRLDQSQILRISAALPEEKLSPEIDQLFFSIMCAAKAAVNSTKEDVVAAPLTKASACARHQPARNGLIPSLSGSLN